jgi:hypothetical protein
VLQRQLPYKSFFAPRALNEFSAAIRAGEIHLPGARITKRALVTANAGVTIRRQWRSTFFAFFFHFQRHRFRRL